MQYSVHTQGLDTHTHTHTNLIMSLSLQLLPIQLFYSHFLCQGWDWLLLLVFYLRATCEMIPEETRVSMKDITKQNRELLKLKKTLQIKVPGHNNKLRC